MGSCRSSGSGLKQRWATMRGDLAPHIRREYKSHERAIMQLVVNIDSGRLLVVR